MHNFPTLLEKCEDGITAVYLTSNGASAIPPTRALSDTIHKVYTVGYPTASTCSNVLHIPLHLTEYER